MADVSGSASRSEPPLGRVLGEGAHSVVYLDQRRGQPVAIKVSRKMADEQGTHQRFRMEAAALARVRHAGLVRALECGVRRDGHSFVVLEHVEGETLADRLAKGPLDERAAVQLGLHLAETLAAVHTAGLVHRDVKPANVLMPEDGGPPRLIDFGLVTDRRAEEASAETVGTFLYAAPEQTGMLKVAVDGRADLYALGVILFECVAGRTPFVSSDPGQLIHMHAVETPPALRQVCPQASEALDALVSRLLNKDPDDRYGSASAVAHDLTRLLQDKLAADDLLRRPVRLPDPTSLIERQETMGKLMSRLESAKRGRGSLVTVDAAWGLGGPALVGELSRRLDAFGGLTLWAAEPPDTPPPLFLFKQLASKLLQRERMLGEGEAQHLRQRIQEAVGDGARLLRHLLPELSPLLAEPDEEHSGAESSAEIHHIALAQLFAALGTKEAPALLVVPEPQELDSASQQVLKRVIARLRTMPVILLCLRDVAVAEGDDPEPVLGTRAKLSVTLQPLSDEGVSTLACKLLGSGELDAELVQQLSVRTGGNPLAVFEHIQAMLEAGALVPDWGGWRLERDQLAKLELSGDAQTLIVNRLKHVDPEGQQLLSRGALLGTRFEAPLLAGLCERSEDEVRGSLLQSVEAGILECDDEEEFIFLHDGVREQLVEALPAAQRAELHRRVASLLAQDSEASPEVLYEQARHAALGADAETAEQACLANLRAGRCALREQAPEEAAELLTAARSIAEQHECEVPRGLYSSLATAHEGAGNVADCLELTDLAVADLDDPLERVRTLRKAASLRLQGRGDTEGARQLLIRAYAELGRSMPENTPAMLLSIPLDIVRCFVFERLRNWRKDTGETQRERRFQAMAQLSEVTNACAFRGGHFFIVMGLLFRVLYYGLRAGPSRERTFAFATHELTLALFGVAPEKGLRFHRIAVELAEQQGDNAIRARVDLLHATAPGNRGDLRASSELIEASYRKYSTWLDTRDTLMAHEALSQSYAARGYMMRAARTVRRGLAAVGDGAQAELAGAKDFARVADLYETIYARPALAAEFTLEMIEASGGPEVPGPWLVAWQWRMSCLLETDDLSHMDEAIEQAYKSAVPPKDAGISGVGVLLMTCRARAAQAMVAEGQERERRLQQLEEATKRIKLFLRVKPVAAMNHQYQAVSLYLRGQHEQALHQLAQADVIGHEADAPEVAYQSGCIRARVLRDMGREDSAYRCVLSARQLAGNMQWRAREQKLADQASTFASYQREARSSEATRTVAHTVVDGASGLDMHRLRRDRDALLDVALASAGTFNPRQQACAALDSLVRILAAERGFLFLWDEQRKKLTLLAGRDAKGLDLPEQRMPSKLIAHVCATRDPLVVNGSEQASAQGFDMAVAHNLRSMICAPLMLRERFTGIVYLDSSLAKGVFTDGDLDILQGIALQIAISQETAQAAQREIERGALERDLEVTAAVQSLLMPPEDTLVAGNLQLCAFYEPVSHAGGDLWQLARLQDGTLRLLVADVTGHGTASSMVTAAVAGCHRALSGLSSVFTGEDLLCHIDRVLRETCGGQFTMPSCLIDLRPDGTTTLWSAAAPQVLVQRSDGTIECKGRPGHPLGDDEFCVSETTWQLGVGERLLVTTDGLLELEISSGRELGMRRLRTFLSRCEGLGLSGTRRRLMEQVREAQGSRTVDDDLTFVLMERSE